MTLQQIGYFIRLAEELNYTYVARLFFITQPTLSRQIVNLENELNVELFIRKHNSVTLTKEGQFFYEKVKPLYQEMNLAIQETRQLGSDTDTLVIGIQEEQIISSSLKAGIRRLRENHPKLQVKILRATTEVLLNGLSAGKYDVIDIIIYPRKMFADEKLILLPIQTESTYMAIGRELLESDEGEITKEELRFYLDKYPVILPTIFQDAHMVDPEGLLRDNLGLEDFETLRIIESGTPISVSVQVASHLGISVVNQTNMIGMDPEIKMVRILDTEGSYTKTVLRNRDNTNPYVKELMSLIKKEKRT